MFARRTLSVVLVGTALAAPAALAGVNPLRMTSTVVSVDTGARTLTLADHSVMAVGKDVAIDRDLVGKTVHILTSSDEDGMEPASSVMVVR